MPSAVKPALNSFTGGTFMKNTYANICLQSVIYTSGKNHSQNIELIARNFESNRVRFGIVSVFKCNHKHE